MSEDDSSTHAHPQATDAPDHRGGDKRRSWLDRISSALSGEPTTREDLVELLRDAQADASAMPGAAIDKVLLVASGAMPGLYDSNRMVFSADGRSRSYFQFGYWSERPAQALLLLAEARLRSS